MGVNKVTVETEVIDQGWNDIKKEVKKFRNSFTEIGFWGSGDPEKNLAARASVQEYGAAIGVTSKLSNWWLFKFGVKLKKKIITIAARPFNRWAFDKNKKKIWNTIIHEYNRILEGKQGAKKALGRIGEWYVGLIQLTIDKGGFAPNSPATVAEKKSSKPLVDSGEMRRGIKHKETMK